ncbi:DedA family protein [Sulfurimonas diazotrophicus]|uniref:DedA family protein n=1 Tax=Sulfurimonas diazotrophicus TaxID=3131939 RepID=A0ABZ3HBQ1_9BACT
MLAELTQWLVEAVLGLGYVGIFALMAVESSFVPFPSEVVLVPAGYLIAQGEMHPVIVMLMALLGSLSGALINYYLALSLGLPLLRRYGRYVFISERSLERLDAFFRAHGPISTFSGRLLPGIRQLISIPAGLARMPLAPFVAYTALGAGLWSLILVLVGYLIGENEALLKSYLREITLAVFVGVVVLVAFYIYRRRGPRETSDEV